MKIFKKIKQTPSDIHLRNKCTKFQPNQTIFEGSSMPQSFSLVLTKNSSPGPKNENFQKMKKTPPGIYPRNKCTKFQPNRTIFEACSLPQSFSLVLAKNSSPGPKNENFQKMNKALPVIYQRNKCTKFQLNRTSFEA